VGTTSYIIPDDILPNVRFLADRVDDVELVLFEVDDGPNNLPGPEVVAELGEIAGRHDLTYTVHLPLDLRLGDGGDEGHASLVKAYRVIDCVGPLEPWAYVLHLDGEDLKGPDGAFPESDDACVKTWQDHSCRALELVSGRAGGPDCLALENLEHYPAELTDPILERVPVGRCVDVGHLWLDGEDPVPVLEAALPRTRVVHLHGIAERDHKSLAHVPPEQLGPVVALLHDSGFSGVVTLEVFGREDLETSVEVLKRAVEEGGKH
ncbi:MAG: cobamide remodeling phosphodiesterase CbiR, partial [Candidatus Latescibacteria bacterium]|nr:cobamide remodeling phosphodiesterase CbiR [Candidatus Latescibacterota bacterium]